ncbi:hypothetical protein Tco_1550811, partial [Tanacetum coccineum]
DQFHDLDLLRMTSIPLHLCHIEMSRTVRANDNTITEVRECGERSGVHWWRRVEKVVVGRRRSGGVMVEEEDEEDIEFMS